MRLAFAFLTLSILPASAQDAVPLLPDLGKTPGPAHQTDPCHATARRKVSKADRKCVLSRYGKPSYAFTYDHLVPLELGGDDSCDNLWPQPRAEAIRKDKLEDALHRQVCAAECKPGLSLLEAQRITQENWVAGYKRYVTPKGAPFCAVNP